MKNRIRVERAEVRMTQQQLADAVGVSRQTVNAVETGKFVPSTLLALKIARTFRKPVEAIFALEEESDPYRPDRTLRRHETSAPADAIRQGRFIRISRVSIRHAGRNRLHTVRSGPPHSAKRHSGRKEIACPPPGASTTSIASAEVT